MDFGEDIDRLRSPPPSYELEAPAAGIPIERPRDYPESIRYMHESSGHLHVQTDEDASSGSMFSSNRPDSIYTIDRWSYSGQRHSPLTPGTSPPNGSHTTPSPTHERYSSGSSGAYSYTQSQVIPGGGDATYLFDSSGFNSMDLIPIPPAPRRALYRIQVSPNIFNPMSYIIRIERGQGGPSLVDREPFVAEFEMGFSALPARLEFRGCQTRNLSEVFYPYRNVPSRRPPRWCWTRDPNHLTWDWSPEESAYTCVRAGTGSNASRIRLAKMTSKTNTGTTLWVSQGGHEIFDDIFVSALLVERKRLNPAAGDNLRNK